VQVLMGGCRKVPVNCWSFSVGVLNFCCCITLRLWVGRCCCRWCRRSRRSGLRG
jgi:hypothetical protein